MIQPSVCAHCGRALRAKHTGRKRQFCSDRCRTENRRRGEMAVQALKKQPRYHPSGVSRNATNPSTVSKNYRADFAGRASVEAPLWRAIVEAEIFAGHAWDELTSRDGVRSLVARLNRSALVRP
jgi:hypothetical protein